METEKYSLGPSAAPMYVPDPELLALQKRQLSLDLEQRERAEAEFQEQERMKREARKQGALSMQRRHEIELSRQANCAHQHPLGGGTGVRGQRDHHRVVMWVCQYCGKDWRGNDLPIHLRPDMSIVGGPEN